MVVFIKNIVLVIIIIITAVITAINAQFGCVAVLDAMGKLPAGILTGQKQITGDFDECKAISFTDKSHAIEGQMCSINAKAPEGMVRLLTPLFACSGLYCCSVACRVSKHVDARV